MAAKSKKSVSIEFERERETKNKQRFKEVVDDGGRPAVGVLYLDRGKDKQLGNPEAIKVTIEVA